MKIILKIFLIIVLVNIINCGGGGGGSSDTKIKTVTLEADKMILAADNLDEIKLKARGYDKNGNEIPLKDKDFTYYVNNSQIDDNEFHTDTAGKYNFTAEIGDKKSNTLTIQVLDFFNQNNLHEFEIVISRSEWQGMIQDMKDQDTNFPVTWMAHNYRTGKYRAAKMIYRGTQNCPQNIEMENVGIRTKGNTSRRLPQEDDGTYNRFRFKLKFDETFKYDDTGNYRLNPDSDEYKDRKKRDFLGFDALGFSWPMFDNPSRMNVLYVPYLLEIAGVKTPRAVPVKITFTIKGDTTVNKNYGIFNIIEPVNKKFLTKNFGKKSNDGDLYKCCWMDGGPASLDYLPSEDNIVLAQDGVIGEKDWTIEYRPTYDIKTNKDTTDHNAFKTFIKNLNDLNGAALKTYLDANFEVDQFLRYLALNMLIGDPDQYWNNCNNYFFYCNNNGKYQFIPYDFDHGFGSGWYPIKTQAEADANGDPDWAYQFDIKNWPNSAASHIDYTDPNGTIITMFNVVKAADYWTEADWGATPVTSQPTDIYTQPLANKLLAIPEYQAQYIQYIQDFTNPTTGIFSYNNFVERFNHFKNMFNPDASTDYLKNDVDIEEIQHMKLTATWERPDDPGASDTPTNLGLRPASVEEYFTSKLNAINAALP